MEDPADNFSRVEVEEHLRPILQALRSETNPYYRVMAGCILMDAFAKLGLDRNILVNEELDFAEEILAMVDQIQPDQIKDENSGRHGDYEKLSGYSAVFLSIGQLGLKDRLVYPRNYIQESLSLLEKIPAPFFRGRGGSMLFSVITLLGYDSFIFDDSRNYMKEVLNHMDRADELNMPPGFPSRMTSDFPKIYPLVTIMNAVAMSGRAEYLTYGRDRLVEMEKFMAAISPVERTHMGLYYIVALHNLGRLQDQIPDLDDFVEHIVKQWEYVDPGADFFLSGISYSYIIATAMISGRMDLITNEILDRLVDSFPDLDRTDQDRINRPYPFSYALNMLGEIGASNLLFTPRARYGGHSPIAWVIDRLSKNGHEEGTRLYMLSNALISYALRLRGPCRGGSQLFKSFHFRLALPRKAHWFPHNSDVEECDTTQHMNKLLP